MVRSIIAAVFLLAAAAGLHADERLFGYVYEAEVLPKGAMEFEQWITNLNGKDQGVYSRFNLREEFETGLTDRLTTALYLNSKSEYISVPGEIAPVEEFAFEGISSEWKYRLLSPHQSPIGVVVYGELSYNGPEFEAEAKLILQRNLSEDLVFAVNLAIENEYIYEAAGQSIEGKTELSAGLAYRINPAFSLGLETRNPRVWPNNWALQGASAWFLGPNFHYAAEKWWATLAIMPQLSGQPEAMTGDGRELSEFSRVETRLVFGMNF